MALQAAWLCCCGCGERVLVIKLYINREQIDEIRVRRIAEAAEWNDYEVVEPRIPGTVRHCRADGAVALGAVVLTALAEAGYGRRDGAEQS